jgi:PemK-like, MazF-like toxin of type II toxin-antitoxin system
VSGTQQSHAGAQRPDTTILRRLPADVVFDRPIGAPLLRLSIKPTERNGLTAESRLMVDKIPTVRRNKLRDQIGMLDHADVVRLNRALVVFLGIAAIQMIKRN